MSDLVTVTAAMERQHSLHVSRLFEAACRTGDVELFLETAELMPGTMDGWRLAMLRVGRLPGVSVEIQEAFLHIWTRHKFLPQTVGHRPTMAKALRILLRPSNYQGGSIRLFRGAEATERRTRLYGFSWSTREDVARDFAHQRQPSPCGSVLLETTVGPDAILYVRENAPRFEENEVIVDPYRLSRVTIVERFVSTYTAPDFEIRQTPDGVMRLTSRKHSEKS